MKKSIVSDDLVPVIRLVLMIIGAIIIALLCNYCEQYYPLTKYVKGHEYVCVGSTWVHSEDCKCKK